MTFTQAGYKLEGNRIKLNCIETWFSYHQHRDHRDQRCYQKLSQSNVIGAEIIGYAFRVRMLMILNPKP